MVMQGRHDWEIYRGPNGDWLDGRWRCDKCSQQEVTNSGNPPPTSGCPR